MLRDFFPPERQHRTHGVEIEQSARIIKGQPDAHIRLVIEDLPEPIPDHMISEVSLQLNTWLHKLAGEYAGYIEPPRIQFMQGLTEEECRPPWER